jgi:DNA mismatch repair protein MutS
MIDRIEDLAGTEEFSLLRPPGSCPTPPSRDQDESKDWVVDLDLERIIENVCVDPRARGDMRAILLELCQDPQVIRYRQAVLDDILRVPSFESGLRELLPKISSLARYHAPREKGELLYEVTWRLGELETYVQCIQVLGRLFADAGSGILSEGFARLAAIVKGIRDEEVFQNLVRELPDLAAKVRSIASVTIGVNLDQDLQPRDALLVSVNTRRFTSSSLSILGRLFGKTVDREGWNGVAALHQVHDASGSPGEAMWRRNPMLAPLFRDLSEILGKICRPVAAALQAYTSVNSAFLVLMSQELAFYLAGVAFVRMIGARGLPLCKPRLAEAGERVSVLRDTYNASLALRVAPTKEGGAAVVTNDVSFGAQAGMFILTGPNSGGKTTYMQTIGLAHVLAQAGLYVPGSEALLSPVDGIYTHFPSAEQPAMEAGRLGEEAKRLSSIFARATPQSLILLNESLASTSHHESLTLAQDVVKALMMLRARAIYTTHLHELAADTERLNADVAGGSRIASLVAMVEEPPAGEAPAEHMRRTFKIAPHPPSGDSHAREIASRYGISYSQLLDTLRRRGIV